MLKQLVKLLKEIIPFNNIV